MIEVVRLELDNRFEYYESNTVNLNKANIESVETDISNEDIIYIQMVSGRTITTKRTSLNRIIKQYY